MRGCQAMSDDIWSTTPSVWITSFWGWSPEKWGTVGFTWSARRDTIVRETTDPFIMVATVTKTAPDADPDIRGKVTGFYLLSHIKGHRDEFTAPEYHRMNPDQWVYSLKAVRAFSFLPEFRLSVDEFDPDWNRRAYSVSVHSEKLTPEEINRLRRLPYREVPVYGGTNAVDVDVIYPDSDKTGVRAGPVNRSGFSIPGEPLDTPKELYALCLTGDPSAWLGAAAEGRHIFKIGLSVSPKTRLEAFRKAMPRGVFTWNLLRSTRLDGHAPYPTFNDAEAGERKMKEVLGKEGQWLGGEFYAATMQVFDAAWSAGRAAALEAAAGGGK